MDFVKMLNALPKLEAAFEQGAANQREQNRLMGQLVAAQHETNSLLRQMMKTLNAMERDRV